VPKKQYAFVKGGPKRLEISWRGLWRDIAIRLDGEAVGAIKNQRELRQGQVFALPDGSRLNVRLVSKLATYELQVTRNGQPLPGSDTDPAQRHKLAYSILFFVAGLNIALGVLGLVLRSEFLDALGVGFGSIIFGLVFLLAAVFVMERSQIALILAIIGFALDALLGIVLVITAGGSPAVGGVVARVFLFVPLVNGVKAIKQLKATAPKAQ
jgi:hypothetical protein